MAGHRRDGIGLRVDFEGVKTLGAGSAAAYITLVPIFGVLSSAWFLGEPLHISLVAGCAAAVGGMTLMRYGQKGRLKLGKYSDFGR